MRSMFGETSPGAGSPIQSVKGAGAKTLGPPPWPSYDSPSKIPLPKFLEGSPAARPRNEFRPRDLTGGENVDTLENEESTPKCLKPRPHAFFTPPRIREAGAVTGLAALTPISVNAMVNILSLSICLPVHSLQCVCLALLNIWPSCLSYISSAGEWGGRDSISQPLKGAISISMDS